MAQKSTKRNVNGNASDVSEPVNSGSESSVTIGDTNNGTSEPEVIAGFPSVSPIEFIDAGTGDGTPGAGSGDGNAASGNASGGKRRGRPPGSRNTRPAAETSPDLTANIEALLFSVHLMGASLLSVPELELDKQEAKKLSDAIKEVSKHYNVNLDPKKVALFQLGAVATGIYGPRVIAFARRTSRRAAPVPISKPATTAPINKVADSQPLTPSQIWGESPIEDVH